VLINDDRDVLDVLVAPAFYVVIKTFSETSWIARRWWRKPQPSTPLSPDLPSQVFPQTSEERVPDFSLGGFRPVLDLGQQLRLDPYSIVRDPLRERLRLPDQRRQSFP
jgi:hypothetical protein